MGKGRPKGKKKSNNSYGVPNEVANDIRGLGHSSLVDKMNLEYRNWVASINAKKDDPKLAEVKETIKNLKEDMKNNPEYIKLEEEFTRKKEELISEELARFEEECKNLSQPYNEDIKAFKGMFQVAIDEMSERKKSGVWKI